MKAQANIVLVHGAWADGSCWSTVIERLQADGYQVTAPQFPESSLAADVARLRQVLDRQDGPAVVVGHSYGGQIMTALGTDAPNAAGLVYIAAFAPDQGESVASLIKNPPPGGPVPPILPPQDGYLFLDKAKFADAFAADVDAPKAQFMADSQVPWGVNALNGAISEPAWKKKQSWYLVATDDKMIPPPAQRQMSKRAGSSVVEVKGSHAIYVSQPKAVAALIEMAAKDVSAKATAN